MLRGDEGFLVFLQFHWENHTARTQKFMQLPSFISTYILSFFPFFPSLLLLSLLVSLLSLFFLPFIPPYNWFSFFVLNFLSMVPPPCSMKDRVDMVVVKSTGSKVRLPSFESCLYYLLTEWPWIESLNFKFNFLCLIG